MAPSRAGPDQSRALAEGVRSAAASSSLCRCSGASAPLLIPLRASASRVRAAPQAPGRRQSRCAPAFKSPPWSRPPGPGRHATCLPPGRARHPARRPGFTAWRRSKTRDVREEEEGCHRPGPRKQFGAHARRSSREAARQGELAARQGELALAL
jgi:hypothetical protein